MSVARVGQAATLLASLPGLVHEVEGRAGAPAPLLVAGPPAAAGELARELARGGDRELVRELLPTEIMVEAATGAALVYVVKATLTPTDERALREAGWRGIPLVCLVVGDGEIYRDVLPHVPATDIVRVPAVDVAAAAKVAERVAARGDEAVWPLGRALPVMRKPVARALARGYAIRNAVAGVSGSALAGRSGVIANGLRLALRIAAVYGHEPRGIGAPALAGAVAAGFGARALARRLGAGRRGSLLAEAALVYAATLALGRAAAELLEREAPGPGRAAQGR